MPASGGQHAFPNPTPPARGSALCPEALIFRGTRPDRTTSVRRRTRRLRAGQRVPTSGAMTAPGQRKCPFLSVIAVEVDQLNARWFHQWRASGERVPRRERQVSAEADDGRTEGRQVRTLAPLQFLEAARMCGLQPSRLRLAGSGMARNTHAIVSGPVQAKREKHSQLEPVNAIDARIACRTRA